MNQAGYITYRVDRQAAAWRVARATSVRLIFDLGATGHTWTLPSSKKATLRLLGSLPPWATLLYGEPSPGCVDIHVWSINGTAAEDSPI